MEKKKLIAAGLAVGVVSLVLVLLGNPANMGFCIACFLRDISGAFGMHKANIVQYLRPEIIGLVLGAFIIAFMNKEFKPKGGSSPVLRFVLGFFVMVGALMFLGCPLRMALRIAGGDLNAIVGLVGFAAGIAVGVYFLGKGFSLNRTYKQNTSDGIAFVGMNLLMLCILLMVPAVLIFSETGPGSAHAPIIASLVAGLLVGAIAQRTRLCMVGGIRDVMLFKDFTLLSGFIAIIVVVFLGNIATNSFTLSFANQPVAHMDGLWNFLGMALVGLGAVLLGGCPLRQLILAGEGNSDSTIAVLGMIVGAAFCHNLGLASSGAGPTANGKVAVLLGIGVSIAIAVFNSVAVKNKVKETI